MDVSGFREGSSEWAFAQDGLASDAVRDDLAFGLQLQVGIFFVFGEPPFG